MHRRGGPVSLDDGSSPARLAPLAPTATTPLLLAAAAVVAGVLVVSVEGWRGGAVVATVATLVPAARADLRSGLLPNRLTRPGGAVGLLAVIIAFVTHGAQPVGAAVAGSLAMAAPVLGIHLANPDAMGFGDVRVAAVLGLSLGLVDWRLGLLALATASALAIGTAVRRGDRAVAFGPALLAGTTITLVATAVATARGAELLARGAPAWP